jgi:hypothetical protein
MRSSLPTNSRTTNFAGVDRKGVRGERGAVSERHQLWEWLDAHRWMVQEDCGLHRECGKGRVTWAGAAIAAPVFLKAGQVRGRVEK